MLSGTYETLLTAIATSAAALIGLLFVAISVADRHEPADRPAVVKQVRAAAAILAFTNAITVSLFGLVPGNNIGYPAMVTAIGGILFTLAGSRSIFASHLPRRYWWQQFAFIAALLVVFSYEFDSGLDLLHNAHDKSAANELCDLLIILLIVGIARAWELVGDRDTGVLASLLALAGRDVAPGDARVVGEPDPDTDADLQAADDARYRRYGSAPSYLAGVNSIRGYCRHFPALLRSLQFLLLKGCHGAPDRLRSPPCC